MPHAALSTAVDRIGRAALSQGSSDETTEGRLLSRFVQTRDEPVFGELVRRLGPMVLAVCRRVSGDVHLADDAFQASFLVLARRAADVRPAGAVRGWLYGVAVRTAREARAVSARRRRREVILAKLPDQPYESAEVPDADALRILDEEIAALPEHLRAAVVLCEIDGQSRRDAADRLGIPEGTLSSRLAKARRILAAQLRGRGVVLSAAMLSTAAHASAALPPRLVEATTSLASASAPVPPSVTALSTGVMRMMLVKKLKAIPVAVVLVATALGGGWLLLSDAPAAPRVAAKPTLFHANAVRPAPAPGPGILPKGPNRLIFEGLFPDGGLYYTFIDPDGSNEKKLLTDSTSSRLPVIRISLSPDGKQVALVREAPDPPETDPDRQIPRTVHIRDLSSDGPEIACGDGEYVSWSGDGKSLAISVVLYDLQKEKWKTSSVILDLATKTRNAVKLPNDHAITDWSRDGRFFLTTQFTKQRNADRNGFGNRRVWLMRRDGSEAKVLHGNSSFTSGKFSPDGRQALVVERLYFPWHGIIIWRDHKLWVLDIAKGTKTEVAGFPENAKVKGYCWSPDGKRIAYTWSTYIEGVPGKPLVGKTENQLVVCDPDGKNRKVLYSRGGWAGSVTVGDVDWR